MSAKGQPPAANRASRKSSMPFCAGRVPNTTAITTPFRDGHELEEPPVKTAKLAPTRCASVPVAYDLSVQHAYRRAACHRLGRDAGDTHAVRSNTHAVRHAVRCSMPCCWGDDLTSRAHVSVAVVGIDHKHPRSHDCSDSLDVFASGCLIGLQELAAMSGGTNTRRHPGIPFNPQHSIRPLHGYREPERELERLSRHFAGRYCQFCSPFRPEAGASLDAGRDGLP